MFESIKNLEEICRRCLSSEPLTMEQAKWLGKSLDDFLNHRCASLRDAFGLRTPRGGVPWWLEQAMRVRDAALRELAETLGTDGTVTSRARQIAVMSVRYASTGWRFDRDHEVMPDRYKGTVTEFLWRAFKSGAPMPISERRLRSLLA